MITQENIISHEIIGLHTEIIESTNPQILGVKGIIVDETKSMFTINTKYKMIKIPKSNNKWKFSIQNKDVVLDGNKLHKKPQDRLVMKN